VHWHWANLEYANGSQLASLSNRWWDADDLYDFGGEHSLLPDGYGGLLRKVAAQLDVRLEHVVTKITRTTAGRGGATVEVTTGEKTSELQADVVIVSLPLGVLKVNAGERQLRLHLHPPRFRYRSISPRRLNEYLVAQPLSNPLPLFFFSLLLASVAGQKGAGDQEARLRCPQQGDARVQSPLLGGARGPARLLG